MAKYITAGAACGLHPGGALPTDDQVATVLRHLQGSMPGRPGTTQELLRPHQAQLQAWLAEGLRLTKIYRRLRAQGVAVSYSTLYRFAQTACGFGTPTVTVRLADPPAGEAAEVDFGVLGLWPDPATGTRRRVSGLLVTLCHSRYACLAVSLRQDLGALLDGLEIAWTFFGGVVRRLVLDNLTPAVTKADRYTPTLGKVFLEYAQYRGFMVDPTVPVHPTGKPKVERGIPYAREDFFRGETFRDLAEMQTRALMWCRELAGTRLHGTTRQVPRRVFETAEQATLLPLAPTPFDRPTWSQATVHPDHHVQFQRALYSVPTRYVGQRVDVRGDRRLVRIYAPPGPHQDASPADARAAVHGLRRLPGGPDALRVARAGPLHRPGHGPRARRRPVPDRPAWRRVPLGPAPAGAGPPAAGGPVRGGAGERRLRAGPGLRSGRRPARAADPAERARARTGPRDARGRSGVAGPLRAAPGVLRSPDPRGGVPWR